MSQQENQSKIRKGLIYLIATLFSLGFLALIYFLIKFLVDFLSQIGPQPAATIVAALLAFVGVISAQSITGLLNRKLEKERAQLARRSDAYEKMVRDLLEFFQNSKDKTKNGNTKAVENLKHMMVDFGAHAMVWGSNEVLLAWNEYRHQATDDSLSAEKKLKGLATLVKHMRIDLGHKNLDGLHDTDLLRPFINDLSPGKDF